MKGIYLALLSIFTTFSFAFADLDTDLDAYFKLDTDSVSSVGTITGTDFGVSYSTSFGHINGGVDFTGVSDYIALGSTTLKNYGNNDITICAWISPNLTNGTEGAIVSNYNSAGQYAQYQLKLYKTGGVTRPIYNLANSGGQETYTSSFSLTDNVYAHVCIVYVRSSGNAAFYVDGVVDGTTHTFTQALPTNGQGNTSIGRAGDYNGIYYKGYIDEVYIASQALTGTQISELYNAGTGKTYPFSSSGGSSSAGTITGSSTLVIPATLSTSQIITYPTSTSTYSFTSTVASSTQRQAGLIYVVHATSSNPTITWGGTSMTKLLTTDDVSGYSLTAFILNNPSSSASVVISGISASSTKYISQSIWNNATIHNVTDKYTVVNGSNKAYVNLPSLTVPTTIVSAFYTVSGHSGYSLYSDVTSLQLATSTTGEFSLVKSSCTASLNECAVGYKKNFSIFDTNNGVVNGINLYATTTRAITAGLTVSDITGLGTETSFSSCLDYGFSEFSLALKCTMQNMVVWFFGLFIPSQEDVTAIQTLVFNTVTSTSSITTSLFLIPLQFSFWQSSSTVPDFEPLTVGIPNRSGGVDIVSFVPANNSVQQKIDNFLYDFFQIIFGVGTIFWVGFLFLKLQK